MERNTLKKYAPQARRDFIAAVTARALQYGLTKKKSEPVTFQGDVALIGGKPFAAKVGRLQEQLAKRIEAEGFDRVMEAVAYTWFNRFVAIRYMEIHGYLDHGYRVLSHPGDNALPEIVEHAEHVTLPGLIRNKVIELKLAGNKDDELYRMLLVAQCNALHTAMPFLFEKIDDETELLLPENLLHSDSLIRKLVNSIPEENWQEIEIIGWLYQFYISEKKDEVIGKVVKTEDIPAATQLFTPNWIVKYLVQNSIGRLWLMAYPESKLREQMEYFVEGTGDRGQGTEEGNREEEGDREQGTGSKGNRKENVNLCDIGGNTDERNQELSGPNRVAEGDGYGGVGVSNNQEFSEGGTLRTHQSTSPGSGVHSIEHRRGTCAEVESGVSELSVHLTGKQGRSGDATAHSATSGICGDGNNHSGTVSSQRNTSDDKHDSSSPKKQLTAHPALSPSSSSSFLSPAPYPLDPEKLTLLDPACGSGHIEVEAYDLFKAMYLERGYRMKDIPRLILRNNLFGLEIDERAAQLASFALIMKARADDRNVLKGGIRMNIRCIQSSDGIKAEEVYEALTGMDVVDKSGLPPAEEFDFSEEETAPLLAHLRKQSTIETGAGNREQGTGDREQERRTSDYKLTTNDLRQLLSLFKNDDAKTFGSLIRIPDRLAKLLPAIVEQTDQLVHGNDLARQKVAQRFAPIAEQAWILSQHYDAVVTNPPYIGGKGQNPKLKAFLKDNYTDVKSDVFSAFMVRNCELAKHGGQLGFMAPFVWMFISSYEKLRDFFISQKTITSLIQLEYSGFDGATVPICTFTLENAHHPTFKGGYIKLSDFRGAENQAPKTLEAITNHDCGWFHRAAAVDFKKIPGCPIAYWVGKELFMVFSVNHNFSKYAEPRLGMATGDNNTYVRYWSEISSEKIFYNCTSREEALRTKKKWFPYNKGGDFRKWYGNSDYLVDWELDGYRLQNTLHPDGHRIWAHNFNLDFIFKPSITWSFVSSAYFGVRYSEKGFLFDVGGSSAFPSPKHLPILLGFLVSNVAFYCLKALNPTLNFQAGNIGSLPIIEELFVATKGNNICAIVDKCIDYCKIDWDAYERSWDFTTLPLLRPEHHHPKLSDTYAHLRAYWCAMTLEMQRLEEENNRLFIDAYGLQDELTPEVPLEEITLTCNPYYRFKEGVRGQGSGDRGEEEVASGQSLVASGDEEVISRQSLVASGDEEVASRQAPDASDYRLTTSDYKSPRAFPVNEGLEARLLSETMKELLSYAVGCMMGRYSLDVPGLVYAHSGNEGFDPTQYKTFPADDDGIVPLTDMAWFEDDVSERFFTFMNVAFTGDRGQGAGGREEEVASRQSLVASDYRLTTNDCSLTTTSYLEENLHFIAESLGQRKDETPRDTIRRYFATDFFKDHLQTYKRRPIYWLFTSGKQRAFQCLVYLHRYNEGTLSRIRTEYVIPLQGKMAARMEHLASDIAAANTTSQRKKYERERDLLRKQLEELRAFDEKLRHYADQRITLDLDDGVKVNYGKFGSLLSEVKAVTGSAAEES